MSTIQIDLKLRSRATFGSETTVNYTVAGKVRNEVRLLSLIQQAALIFTAFSNASHARATRYTLYIISP